MTLSLIHQAFSVPLLKWFDKHGRKDLPWQHPRTAYRVWISEIMLQQTQVKTVIPYFNRFIARFPDINTLASASEDEVLAHWSGLGYYSRARNLHQTAIIICTHFNEEFPNELHQLVELPGIGATTAAAITSQAFGKPTAILDANVMRVLSRYFLIGATLTQTMIKEKLWQLANACMPSERSADYTQAIMDLGATCCTSKNPRCTDCPVQRTCLAKNKEAVEHYPVKKPKKIIPTKQEQFILLHTSLHLIYLEKRPPTGIWGGLWCLPSTDITDCPIKYINDTYQLQTAAPQVLMTIKHSFSHFHLHITALTMQANLNTTSLTQYPGRWINPNERDKLGLAKPVNDIIQGFLSMGNQTT